MAAIDYGTLIIKDGKVLNKEDELFPDLIIGDYNLYFYKDMLDVFNHIENKHLGTYYFGWDGKYSYYIDTPVGKMKVRTLSRKNRDRFIARVGDYIIIFGYGIDNDKNHSYQKKVMRDYGFSRREKIIISKYLWS